MFYISLILFIFFHLLREGSMRTETSAHSHTKAHTIVLYICQKCTKLQKCGLPITQDKWQQHLFSWLKPRTSLLLITAYAPSDSHFPLSCRFCLFSRIPQSITIPSNFNTIYGVIPHFTAGFLWLLLNHSLQGSK